MEESEVLIKWSNCCFLDLFDNIIVWGRNDSRL